MTTKASEIATRIIQHFVSTRGVGHTTAMFTGVTLKEGGSVVLAATQSHAHQLQRHANELEFMVGPARTTVIPLEDVYPRLLGLKLPLVVDNFALQTLLQGLLEELQEAEVELRASSAQRNIDITFYNTKLRQILEELELEKARRQKREAAIAEVITHKKEWREAIETMQTWAGRLIPPESDEERSYWQQELQEFDRAFADLKATD